jgi:hypothetical protein
LFLDFGAEAEIKIMLKSIKTIGGLDGFFVVFWARQAMPLRTLEPGSVGAWLAVP